MWLVDSITPSASGACVSPKKIENFSTKLTEVGNGFFLLNVQGKIEMLNMLFFTTENNMVLSSLKQELERFGRYTRNCCTTKQATLKDLKCTGNELIYYGQSYNWGMNTQVKCFQDFQNVCSLHSLISNAAMEATKWVSSPPGISPSTSFVVAQAFNVWDKGQWVSLFSDNIISMYSFSLPWFFPFYLVGWLLTFILIGDVDFTQVNCGSFTETCSFVRILIKLKKIFAWLSCKNVWGWGINNLTYR